MENCKELDKCLCCDSDKLRLTLDLGVQPMANSFKKTEDEDELKFPLRLNLCEECTHLQLSHAVNPDLLFKNYLYVSGTSQTLKDYFDWFADYTLEFFDKKPTSVLDIACNDGTQLDSFKDRGFTTYGIDPAENLYELSSKNHEVICDYFTDAYVYKLKQKNIDVINAQNVFAHNSYPVDFLKMCKEIMHDDSVLFIQTSQADMVRNNEFDTIYHEHLSFFNANSMSALAQRAGIHLIGIKKTPIHGNSYVFVFSKTERDSSTVKEVLAEEQSIGLQNLDTYAKYSERCQLLVQDLKVLLDNYKKEGYIVAGYGAAAKGMTLINYADLFLDFIIDDNPLKQGRFTPGKDIEVVPIDVLDHVSEMKVVFVPLAWNFFTEIKNKIKAKRDNKDDIFIKYFPKITAE